MPADALTLLQTFFRDLFQFDLADLDFGLYRLFHLKREEIEQFIVAGLPREVEAAFSEYTTEENAQAQMAYDDLKARMLDEFGQDALLPDGNVSPDVKERAQGFKSARELVAAYETAHQKVTAIQVTEGHKAEVFNHLYAFFSRYYEDGDFIPKRRYGSKETYAVPYNGEEVFFHWANRDQHYVKTAERFRDYTFKVRDLTGEYRVRFTMAAASIPKDNTKGKTRYFFPRADLAEWNAETRTFVLPFEYRLPTPEEVEQHGTNSKGQASILQAALSEILTAIPDDNLRALVQQDQRTGKQVEAGDPELPLLLKRLRHFCRKNTSDFFIHKDLRGFLTRELDFYVKDQVLHVMDMEADLEAKRRVIRVFRRLARKVIDFLANIEDAEKRLFEKKKFVLETDYLIPIQHIPETFWTEILHNEAQLDEWRAWGMLEPEVNLFNQRGEVNAEFLRTHPTLGVHTRHFERAFVRRLLEALPFDGLDEATDGLLVHGENYQALRLLEERWREQVQCIYIDPPYNKKDDDDFIYKDNYRHAAWLAMMTARLQRAYSLMKPDGALFVSVDDNEQANLRLLMDRMFGVDNLISTMVWEGGLKNDSTFTSVSHDYIVNYVRDKEYIKRSGIKWRTRKEGIDAIYSQVVKLRNKLGEDFEKISDELNKWYRGLPKWHPSRAHKHYNRVDERGIFFAADISAESGRTREPYDVLHPVTKKPCKRPLRGWPTRATMDEYIRKDIVLWGDDHTTVPKLKKYLHETEGQVLPSVQYRDRRASLKQLRAFLGQDVFSNPKDPYIIAKIIEASGHETSLTLDFFAGSGTTGHAVINLNREDGGQRKFILVEMGAYFDTVLLPRIAKVMYTPEWKDGKPKRPATPEETERTPRLVKIIRLESYEDTLHNLAAAAEKVYGGEREQAIKALAGEEAFLLRYWLDLPLAETETTLRSLNLAHPFDYHLEIPTDEGPVFKHVDVVETFNYLYGLRVRRYETWYSPGDDDRQYRAVKATDREGKRRILVLWRDMQDYAPENERAFLEDKLSAMEQAGEIWDEIWINGDSPTPGIVSLDPLFKRLMMQGEAP